MAHLPPLPQTFQKAPRHGETLAHPQQRQALQMPRLPPPVSTQIHAHVPPQLTQRSKELCLSAVRQETSIEGQSGAPSEAAQWTETV